MPFPVTCPACGKSFSISDDVYDQKIKGRVVSVKCKQCQAAIRVDGTKTVAPAGGSVAVAPPASPANFQPQPAPEAAAPPEPGPPSNLGTAPATAIAVGAEPAAPPAEPAAPPAESAAQAPTPTSKSEVAEPRPQSELGSPAARVAAPAPNPTLPRGAATRAPLPAAIKAVTPVRAAPFGASSAATGGAKPPLALSAAKPAAARPAITPLAAPIPGAAPSRGAEASASEPLLFAVDSPDGDRELTEQQIAGELAQGSVTPETLVWRDGMAEWLEIKKVPELARHLKRPEPAKAAPKLGAPNVASAPRFRPRQPTLPMGAIPYAREGAETPVSDTKAEAPVEEAPVAQPPARHLGTTVRQIPAPRPVIPRAPMPTPVPMDEEPTILRAPADMAALLQLHGVSSLEPARPTLPTPGPRDEETVPVPLSSAGRGRSAGLPTLPGRALSGSPIEEGDRLPWLDDSGGSTQRQSSPDFESSVSFGSSGMPTAPSKSSPDYAVSASPQQRIVSSDTFRETPEARRAWEEAANGSAQPANQGARAAAGHGAGAPNVATRTGAPLPSAPFPASGPFPASFPATSDLEGVPFRPKRSNALWVVLVLLLLAAAAGGAFVVMRKRAAILPPLSPFPAESAATAAAAAEPNTPTPLSAPAAEAEADAKAEAAPEPVGPAQSQGRELPGAPGASPANSAGGDFAQQFATAAKHAEASGAHDRFDAKAAKAAVEGVTAGTARCREVGGPVGVSRVVVTFAPSGSVSSASVSDAPLSGTSTAACIATVFQKASVKPFSGAPGSVTHKISIQ